MINEIRNGTLNKTAPLPMSILPMQFRCHPSIVELVCSYIYKGRFSSSPLAPTESIIRIFPFLLFLDISPWNSELPQYLVVLICVYASKGVEPEDILILTSGKEQWRKIREHFKNDKIKDFLKRTSINNVDKEQGWERQVVIYIGNLVSEHWSEDSRSLV